MIPWLDEERAKADAVREATITIDGVHYCHITPDRLRALLEIASRAEGCTKPAPGETDWDTLNYIEEAVQAAEGAP